MPTEVWLLIPPLILASALAIGGMIDDLYGAYDDLD